MGEIEVGMHGQVNPSVTDLTCYTVKEGTKIDALVQIEQSGGLRVSGVRWRRS